MRERKRKVFNEGYKSGLVLGRVSKIAIGFGILFMLGLLYLSQQNAISVKGYKISDMDKQLKDLQEEKQRLEIEATRLQSIQEIQKSQKQASLNSMVSVQKIDYLPAASVALK